MAIMWTNTRGKSAKESAWSPNHFALLRPRQPFEPIHDADNIRYVYQYFGVLFLWFSLVLESYVQSELACLLQPRFCLTRFKNH